MTTMCCLRAAGHYVLLTLIFKSAKGKDEITKSEMGYHLETPELSRKEFTAPKNCSWSG